MSIEGKSLYESPVWIAVKFLAGRRLRGTCLRCLGSIARNFFLLQYKARLFPKRFLVSQCDHPLDERVPFNPRWVAVYLDFVAYWVRIAGFITARFGVEEARRFVQSIGELYAFAAQVYRKNMSTTRRPRYLKRFRFFMIHLFDPHLMCIPSLHVMIVIRGCAVFRALIAGREDCARDKALQEEAERLRRSALDITQAILYVKQHSINCISAAMYAMSRFDPPLFPPEEAEFFVNSLFNPGGAAVPGPALAPDDIPPIRAHILSLYRSFMEDGAAESDWRAPLFRFLASLPPASRFGANSL